MKRLLELREMRTSLNAEIISLELDYEKTGYTDDSIADRMCKVGDDLEVVLQELELLKDSDNDIETNDSDYELKMYQ